MQRKFKRYRLHYARARRRHIGNVKVMSRHPFAVPFFAFFFLVVLSLAGYLLFIRPNPPAHDARVVIISHDHMQQTVPSIEPTVGALLKKLNLTLNQGDVVEPALTTPIKQDDFRINIYRALPVEIVDGSQKSFTFSAATTPRSIAKQNGVNVYPEDTVTTDPVQDFLADGAIGQQVVIDRATPINVNLYGSPITMRTHAVTVGQLLKEKSIHLAKDDQVTPAVTTPITPGQQIFITRNGVKIESVTQPIAMPVQVIQDNSLAYGTSAIRQQGSPGQQVITYQVNLQNGLEVSRTPIQTVVTQQPVTQIVVQGINLQGIKGDMALAGISPGDYDYVDYIVSHESGWCPTKAQGEHYCPSPPDDPMTPNGYGLCQATPGYKMATAGSDWQTNPVTQLRWCSGYASARYGSWANAYYFWVNHHYW
ncbi:MAG TPA: ubiquitin-like domain-containing protein [Candidatus Saccharimonadales bacterium]|nr:ubiquitin-like domain-containing protein [Candidatus Saccharimonadales bacterium]